MTSGSHHTVCVTDDDEGVLSFLADVIGLEVQTQLSADGKSTAEILSWPDGNPGAVSWVLGTGTTGLIELVRLPEPLRGTVSRGAVLVSFVVPDLEERVAACRERGLAVSGIIRVRSATVNVSAAVVRVGGIAFELVRFERD